PPAAARLCTALRRRIAEERIWVWYTVAPMLPLVREVDVARAGCSVRVPEARLRMAPPGQERYILYGRVFRDVLQSSDARPLRDQAVAGLRELSANRFETLTRTPPLLYHNALSATPPHYHWSADAGYALWLRLYVELTRRSAGTLALPVDR